jgi:deoxyribodipyrimidine photo-lyase
MTGTGVVLFTRDLRAHDHPALAMARARSRTVVPLFVLDDRLLAISRRRTELLLERLAQLREAIGLRVVKGDPVEEIARFTPDAVYLSEDVTAYARRRVRRLREHVEVHTLPGIAIVPPGDIAPAGKSAYRVFTPYWRAWRSRPLPARVASGPRVKKPDLPLSALLHLGLASPAEVARGADEELLRKLCWRDFFAQLLAAEPTLEWRDMHQGRRVWRDDPDVIEAWKQGRTGVPFVDAAMRQLLEQGFLPNRQRMVAASYLTKDLGVDWRIGAAHFMAHLVDGDVASNSGNWQWVAGTGADTRPNRRLNPERQARLHDRDGAYVRRWLPERTLDPAVRDEPPAAEIVPRTGSAAQFTAARTTAPVA